MNDWQFWNHDDPDAHAAGAAAFWPGHVVAVAILGVVLTLVVPRWTGNSVWSAALVAPLHLAMHAVTFRPGMFARAPRFVSTLENFTNLALMMSYAVNAARPHPLLWVLAAGFVVLVALSGRPAISFALAAALFPAIGTALRALVLGTPVTEALLLPPLGAGAVLAATYVFVTFIRAGQRADAERRRRDEQARIVEAERQRIARELHDDVGATLAEINLWLGIAERGVHVEALTTARERARAATVTLREMLVPLRAASSTSTALASAIDTRVAGLARASGMRVTVSVEPGSTQTTLDGVIAHSAQMFALEAASNAIRHGAAQRFHVELGVVEGAFSLTARDDGQGFDAVQALAEGRLVGLRQRAEACGGTFTATSRPGETMVQLLVPLR
ncbi:MAG TPA: histidine kinase [Myxococcota bacterium]